MTVWRGPVLSEVEGALVRVASRGKQTLTYTIASFAPLGLPRFPLLPTANAVGCILTPLRGWAGSCTHLQPEIRVLTNAYP